MKKITLLLLIFIIFSISIFSLSNNFAFKVGYYFPSELKSGVIWGIDYGYAIDENVSVVLTGDLYYKKIRDITKKGEIEQVGVKQEIFQKLNEWKGLHIPLTVKFKVKFPVGSYKIKPYGALGIGYGMTHVSFEGTDIGDNNIDDSITYTGFVWQASGGILYRLGSRSNLVAELMYNGAKFEKDNENYFTTLNSSGLVIRTGIDILLF
ncbi:MAG TPA: outer membrane beta-barrel protein [Candidatus Mcinerneyibacterium sp.]|nr:outer membrane beta-barrel protein [Candidatus Mcinerneyibacterium sp.]